MLVQLRKDIRSLISDDTTKLSLAKTMLGLGFLFVSSYMVRLIISHQFTPDYLIIYCCFISGQHLGSKFLDRGESNATS